LTGAEAADVEIRAGYLRYLGRQVDAIGLTDAEHALLSGMRDELFIASLVASDEYFARTAP
jgi:hypothetical protein